MQLITKRSQYATLAERFAQQTDLKVSYNREVYTKLVRLGEAPDQKAADEILNGWHGPMTAASLVSVPACMVCRERRGQVVSLLVTMPVSPPVTVYVCGDCLIKALNLTEENC